MTELATTKEEGPSSSLQSETECDELCPHFRVGFPIFPVRYAILPKDSSLPQLDGNVKNGDPSVGAIDPDAARYGLRLLRSGYLYVFDENVDRLEGYAVDENAILFNMHLGSPALSENAHTQPCSLNAHIGNASCITIPNADQARKPIWIAYSDVEWTRATREAHKSPEVREKHMVRFDVQAWLSSQQHAGAVKVGEVDKQVAEFALYDGEAQSARQTREELDWSATPPIQAGWRASGVKYVSERLLRGLNRGKGENDKVQGVVLALPDPVGIAQDLAVMMQHRYEAFISRPAVKRRLSVSAAIQQIESAVKNQVELREFDAAEQLANEQIQHESWLLNSAIDWAFDTDLTKQAEARVEGLRNVTAAELDRAISGEWARYAGQYNPQTRRYEGGKYDENARAAWQAAFDKELRQFDVATMAPLARAHAAWMKSDGMVNGMECNYDPADIHNGAVYARTVLLCLAGTQDKQACFNTYFEWLDSRNVKSARNFVMRAMLYNQDAIVDQVQKNLDQGLDLRTLPWPSLIGLYDSSLEALSGNAKATAATLVEQLFGPFMKALDKAVDSGPARAAGVALGLVARKAIVPVTEVGSKKRFRAALIRHMLKLQGGNVSEHQMQRAVSAELRRLQARGVSMNGNGQQTWLLFVDPDEISRIPANVTGQQRANQLARSMRTPTQFETSEVARWRSVIDADVRLGTVGGVLEAWCLTKLWQEVAEAMPHEQGEANRRFAAGVVATIGSTAETTGKYLKNRFANSLRYARMGSAGRVMAKLGGRAAVVAGVVMSVFDFIKAGEERAEGNGGIARAYYASAFLGVGVIVAFLIGGPIGVLIGLVLLALLFAVTVLIELFKDNKFQDWLERCYEWGKLVDQRYSDIEVEMNALKTAYEGG